MIKLPLSTIINSSYDGCPLTVHHHVHVCHLHESLVGDLSVVSCQDLVHLAPQSLLDLGVQRQLVQTEAGGGGCCLEPGCEEQERLGCHLLQSQAWGSFSEQNKHLFRK